MSVGSRRQTNLGWSVALETIIVQLPALSGPETPEALHLSPGDVITFGRDGAADLVLTDPQVPRTAGRVRAVEDYWVASNLTASQTFVIEHPESAGEYLKLPPRRLDLPVPFEFARVIVHPDGPDGSFLVFAPAHTYADVLTPGPGDTEPTLASFSLDESAKYFRVLVALCEPRLRDPTSLILPTAAEVCTRLEGTDLSRAAVNFQIDYLARTKLRARKPNDAAGKADWQREALVRIALRFDLVTPDHLALLP